MEREPTPFVYPCNTTQWHRMLAWKHDAYRSEIIHMNKSIMEKAEEIPDWPAAPPIDV
jgi:hypothetical protein